MNINNFGYFNRYKIINKSLVWFNFTVREKMCIWWDVWKYLIPTVNIFQNLTRFALYHKTVQFKNQALSMAFYFPNPISKYFKHQYQPFNNCCMLNSFLPYKYYTNWRYTFCSWIHFDVKNDNNLRLWAAQCYCADSKCLKHIKVWQLSVNQTPDLQTEKKLLLQLHHLPPQQTAKGSLLLRLPFVNRD